MLDSHPLLSSHPLHHLGAIRSSRPSSALADEQSDEDSISPAQDSHRPSRSFAHPVGSYFNRSLALTSPAGTPAHSFMLSSAISSSARKAELEQTARELFDFLAATVDPAVHPDVLSQLPPVGSSTISQLRQFFFSARLTGLLDDVCALRRRRPSPPTPAVQPPRPPASSVPFESVVRPSSGGGGGSLTGRLSDEDASTFALFERFLAARSSLSQDSFSSSHSLPPSYTSSPSSSSTSDGLVRRPAIPQVATPLPPTPMCCVTSPLCQVSSSVAGLRCSAHGRLAPCVSAPTCSLLVPVSDLHPCPCSSRSLLSVLPPPQQGIQVPSNPFTILDAGKLRSSFNWSLISSASDRVFLRQFSDALLLAVSNGTANPVDFPLGNWVPLSASLVAQANSFVLTKDLVLPKDGVVCMANLDSVKKRKEKTCKTPLDSFKAVESYFRMMSIFYPTTASDNDAMCKLITVDLWAGEPDQEKWRKISNHFVESVRHDKAHLPIFAWNLQDPQIMVRWIEAKSFALIEGRNGAVPFRPAAAGENRDFIQHDNKRLAPDKAKAALVPHWHNLCRKAKLCIAAHNGDCKRSAGECLFSHDAAKFLKDITSPQAVALEPKWEARKEGQDFRGGATDGGGKKRK